MDLIHGVITIVRAKGNNKRHVQINTRAIAAGRAQATCGRIGPGLPWGMGKDGYWSRWCERAIAVAGLNDFKWHDLRHTIASRLRMNGVGLATIKELLGHTTLQMVLRYAHLAPRYLKAAIEKIAAGAPGTQPGITTEDQDALAARGLIQWPMGRKAPE